MFPSTDPKISAMQYVVLPTNKNSKLHGLDSASTLENWSQKPDSKPILPMLRTLSKIHDFQAQRTLCNENSMLHICNPKYSMNKMSTL